MMDGGPGIATSPGPDAQPQTLGYHLQAALAIIGQDRQVLPDEQREIQAFMVGIQAIATQKSAPMQQPGMPSSETSDLGDSEGVDDLEQPDEGNEYV